jgi:hypothetical protein
MAAANRQQQIQDLVNAAVQAAQQAMQQQINAAQNDIAALRAQNAALQQAAAAPAAVQQQAIPAAAQPVQFAYTPGTYGAAATLIDYNSTNGAKIQKSATEKLDVLHDLDSENLNDFLESFRTRAIAQGWFNTLLTVTQGGIAMNFIDNYGVLSFESIETMAHTYMFQEVRAAQDSHNCFCCLEASLTKDARTTLYAERDKYTIRRGTLAATPAGAGIPQGGDINERRRDGLLFLWCILNRTTAKTNATISTIVRQLNHLAELMSEHNSDVSVFNTQVRRMLNSYYANKRDNFDPEVLLQNLFEAYASCKDRSFVLYVQRKEQEHIDGTVVTPEALMDLALKQYQTLVQKKVWGNESAEHKEIMSLSAQIVTLKKKVLEQKKTDTRTPNTDGKGKVSQQEWQKMRYDKAPKWMKKKPTDLNQKKKKGDSIYTWCSYHKLWQKHTSADCRLNPAKKDQQQSNKADDKKEENNRPDKSKVRFDPQVTMAATAKSAKSNVECDDDDDTEEEDF